MSYKLFSFKTGAEHDLDQWQERSMQGELESFKTRTLVGIFDKFMKGKKLRILEGGCGFGAWCLYFRDRGHEIVGIEYDKRIVERAVDYDKTVPVVLGDITDLKYPDSSFDAYISLGVIEHFEHGPEKALAEAHRILKPGGLAFVTTPYLTVFRRLVAHPLRSLFFLTRTLRGKPRYYWEYRFTGKELRNYLEQAGFEIIYTDIDDYLPEEKNRHIGLWADFFFLRKRSGEIWELNGIGKALLKVLKVFSPWFYCSGIQMVARAVKPVVEAVSDGSQSKPKREKNAVLTN
jgi:SAM-dependent methyltransferase